MRRPIGCASSIKRPRIVLDIHRYALKQSDEESLRGMPLGVPLLLLRVLQSIKARRWWRRKGAILSHRIRLVASLLAPIWLAKEKSVIDSAA